MGVDEEVDEELAAVQKEVLRHRKPYESLQELHSLLFEQETFSHVRSVIEVWMRILADDLDEWLTKMVKTLVMDKIRGDTLKREAKNAEQESDQKATGNS
jgi:hypothetical protein